MNIRPLLLLLAGLLMLTGCKDDTSDGSTSKVEPTEAPAAPSTATSSAPKAAKNVSLGIRFSKPDNKEKFELVMAALDEMQTVQDMPMRPKDSKAFKAAMNTLCPSKVRSSIYSLQKERDSKVKDAANRADSACYTLRPLTLFKWQVAEMNKRPRMTGSEKNQRCYGRGSASSLEGLHRIVKTMLVKKENKRNPAVAKAAMTAKTYCGPPDQAKLL